MKELKIIERKLLKLLSALNDLVVFIIVWKSVDKNDPVNKEILSLIRNNKGVQYNKGIYNEYFVVKKGANAKTFYDKIDDLFKNSKITDKTISAIEIPEGITVGNTPFSDTDFLPYAKIKTAANGVKILDIVNGKKYHSFIELLNKAIGKV